MWLERLKVIAVLAGLIGFVAMLISVARADRSAKKALARREDPKFSRAWFIFYFVSIGSKCITGFKGMDK
jgi:hypothetical protein